MLCASAYTASDYAKFGLFKNKCYKWGYFPEKKVYDVEQLMAEKEPATILWAARMIDWKHPELPLRMAKSLKEQGIPFHLEMIGGGELEPEVRRLRTEYGLEAEVDLPGFKEPAEVRKAMERAEIYLVTSDRKEGWGAVVNEAMNSGCAVVADHMIGAAPWLIRQGENGRMYRDGEEQELFRTVERLLRDPGECRRLGENAQQTIVGEWNARTAAERLIELCRKMKFLPEMSEEQEMPDAGQDVMQDITTPAPVIPQLWNDGPCSPAPVIPERSMYRRINSEQ
jgi:glycosyltransferase involved in cell wall biosynthesis